MSFSMKKLVIVAIGAGSFALSTGAGLSISFAYAGSSQVRFGTELDCKDLMVELVDKPPEFQFLECKEEKQAPSDVLVARYRVPGKDAATVENFLQQKFNMSKLRFLCCGWEPVFVKKNNYLSGHGTYRDKRGYYYKIIMFSEETLLNQRQDWKNIPFFYVTVTKFLDDL